MKSFTIQVDKVENGFVAQLVAGGRWNPLPFGKSKFVAADLEQLLAQVGPAVRKAMEQK